MTDRFSMNPELRGLLTDLAGDGAAELLRVGPAQAGREAFAHSPHVSSSAPFLAQAERRLLEVHREEAAQLLYLYAAWIREDHPRYRAHTHYKDAQALPPRGELDRRARHVSGARLSASDAGAARLLRACLSRGGEVTPSAALAAALRLAPSDSIRIFQGLSRCLELQDARGGRELLLRVLGETLSPRLASYAQENLGMIAAQEGDLARAARHYEAAVQADHSRVLPKLSWLHFSLVSGLTDSARRGAELVDLTLTIEDEGVRWFLGLSGLGNGSTSNQESRRTLAQLEDGLGQVARAVAHGH